MGKRTNFIERYIPILLERENSLRQTTRAIEALALKIRKKRFGLLEELSRLQCAEMTFTVVHSSTSSPRIGKETDKDIVEKFSTLLDAVQVNPGEEGSGKILSVSPKGTETRIMGWGNFDPIREQTLPYKRWFFVSRKAQTKFNPSSNYGELYVS